MHGGGRANAAANEGDAFRGSGLACAILVLMETAICNVRDIEASQRRWIEAVVGQPLHDHQQVIIQVVDVGLEPDRKLRASALAEAGEIARQGRANAAAHGVTEEEIDAAIEEAKRHTRSR
ncbi:MAG TPA: hypothetical protein PK867_24385 [Pirellulales bacterium]|nr:hypothetical protein [Pirellulales bacterium]